MENKTDEIDQPVQNAPVRKIQFRLHKEGMAVELEGHPLKMIELKRPIRYKKTPELNLTSPYEQIKDYSIP